MPLSRKKASKLKIDSLSPEIYIGDQDIIYLSLLRCARQLDRGLELELQREKLLTLYETLVDNYFLHERLIPLFNENARTLNLVPDLSEKCRTILFNYTQKGIVTEIGKKNQLLKIIDAFSAKNIPIILLKGTAFAELLYTKNAPRTSNDLDILVKKDDWQCAIQALNQIMVYQKKKRPDIFGDSYEVSFIPKNNVGAALDLHKNLVHEELFLIDEDKLWSESLEHPLYDSHRVRILCPEHAIIHQAIHAYKDMNFAKYNLVDTHELISRSAIDFPKLHETALHWGVKVPLYVLLINSKNIMNSKIQYEFEKAFEPNKLVKNACRVLLKSKHRQPLENKKTVPYRLNQILSQYFFTTSLFRPLKLQSMFVFYMLKRLLTKVHN